MTRPIIGGTCFALITIAASAWSRGAIDPTAAALVARLARPAPAVTQFVEVRFSSLLATPLVTSGQLRYLGPDRLERSVEGPFCEVTTIQGDGVTVAREGEPHVRLSLSRVPVLQAMLSSIGALLAGDSSSLERHFVTTLHGNNSRWQLVLTPADPRVRTTLTEIQVDGSHDEPRCFTLREPDGDASVIVIGDAVPHDLPEPLDRASLDTLCQEGP